MIDQKKILIRSISLGLFGFLIYAATLNAQTPTSEPQANYLFRDQFYAPPSLKIRYDVYETAGFLLFRPTSRGGTSEFSVVTGFHSPMIDSRVLKNIRDIDQANKFLKRNVRKIFHERVPIRELPLLKSDGSIEQRFWVGQKAFQTLEQAQREIELAKSTIETGGGNFDRALELVSEFFSEAPAPTEEEVRENYLREEQLALKILDSLDIGEKPFGILTGTPMGEPILWQAFGETSFRFTNFSVPRFNSEVGFWTNRLVFRGLRFIGEQTIDPYVEVTAALESNGTTFADHLDLVAGLEYRPFGRAAFFDNFQLNGFYLLKFIRNYRLYVQYMERRNLGDEITGGRDTDLWFGTDVFYEWGLDLDEPWVEHRRKGISDWAKDLVWGEYFGNYRFERSDFSSIDSFDSWVLNSSVILGTKWPEFDLPRNPINNQLTLMPYLKFEHVTNRSRAGISFQNRYLFAAGVRWMPFRSYQFQSNEWLYLTKIFAEYSGIGGALYPEGSEPNGNEPIRDWIIGIKTSYKRF